jgi:hypothetical protein
MFLNGLAISVLLLTLQQTPSAPTSPASAPAQATSTPIPRQTVPAATTAQTPATPIRRPATVNPTSSNPILSRPTTSGPSGQGSSIAGSSNAGAPADCNGFPCDTPQPRVIAVNPPPTPQPWTLHEKIAWAAYIVLAVLGYAGIMLALSMLRKIERQTAASEAAAVAAQNSAQAALLNAQAIIDAERPWILITVEPSLHVENGFTVTATNRGRSPAQIVSTTEQVKIAADETRLGKKSESDHREPVLPKTPIILLPGESTGLKPFSRADARGFCESDEQFARIESWEEKMYLFGRVVYRDLIAPAETQFHQTDWCCWYIHGRQKSGLVIAGPPEYNLHT